jgi:hypothetical protein
VPEDPWIDVRPPILKYDWLLIPFLFPKESNHIVLFVIIMTMKHFALKSLAWKADDASDGRKFLQVACRGMTCSFEIIT